MTWTVKFFEEEDTIQIFNNDELLVVMPYFTFSDDNVILAQNLAHFPDLVRLAKMIVNESDNEALRFEAKNILAKLG